MSNKLYEEAIADAKSLREMAEQSAKNKIIDAVTPQIRRLIERQILGEQDEEELDDLEGLSDVMPPEEFPDDGDEDGLEPDVQAGDQVSLDLDQLAGPAVDDDLSGTKISVEPDGDVAIQVGDVTVDLESDSDEEEDLVLDTQVAEALAAVIKSRSQRRRPNKKSLRERTKILRNNMNKLESVLESSNARSLSHSQRKIVCNYYTKLLREAISLKDDIILTERDLGTRSLEKHTNNILKEIREMATRRRSIFDRLFEQEEKKKEEEELKELDAVLSLEPADDEELEAAEDLLGDLEIEFELETEELGEEGEEGEEGGDLGEEGDEEGGDEELELDLGEAEHKEKEVDEVYEIDETMLRRELRRMRRLREQDEAAATDPHLNHGGEDEGDMFVDVDEETLLNALEDELGDAPSPDAGSSVAENRRRRRRANARRPRKANVKEARVNRALRSKLVEYKRAVLTLRKQLTEMNLFNAKLLYANKLMQNRNLNQKQQRAVVEALDNARTLREAKLLFKSLTSSLKRSKAGTLSEGRARTLGSSSRSTRRGSSTNNGVGVDRWAVLAGLNKDKS